MVFAWRISDGSFGRMALSVLVVGLATALFAVAVRVRIQSPPRRSHRRGAVMLEPREGAGWFDRLCAESTPFPAPLDVQTLDDVSGALEKHPAWAESGAGASYVPRFRFLSEEKIPDCRNASKPVRVDLPPLPPLPEVPEVSGEPETTRRVPVLRADSPELALRIPVALPAFRPESGAQPPPGDHRFLLEVDSGGRVLVVVPMSSSEDPEALAGMVRWLRSLRFKPDAGGRKWYVVSLTFIFSGGHD
jgi:hypothetical protein